jgi:hypothetical protein
MLEATGIIKSIEAPEQVTESFKKSRLVLELDSNTKYPQEVQFQLINKNCDLVNSFAEGQTVTVTFNLRGRKGHTRTGDEIYYNALDVYKIKLFTI